MQPLMERITGALAAVRNPRTGADVMAAEQVRDIATSREGKVRLTLLLAPGRPSKRSMAWRMSA
jgi:ATP-binding protein involved in chromosome partitioning